MEFLKRAKEGVKSHYKTALIITAIVLSSISIIVASIFSFGYDLTADRLISLLSFAITLFIAVLTFLIQIRQNNIADEMKKLQEQQANASLFPHRKDIFADMSSVVFHAKNGDDIPDKAFLAASDRDKLTFYFNENIADLSITMSKLAVKISIMYNGGPDNTTFLGKSGLSKEEAEILERDKELLSKLWERLKRELISFGIAITK